jgi:hypothetical protein
MRKHKPHMTKHTSPTKWDKAPYTTIWRIEDPSSPMIFIQMSDDIENPNWVPMADIMVKAFDRFYSDESFIEDCIKLYKSEIEGMKNPFECVDFVKRVNK